MPLDDQATTVSGADRLVDLEAVIEAEDLDAFLTSRSDLHTSAVIQVLTREASRLARSDLDRAQRLNAAAARLAQIVDEDYSYALSLRSRGHQELAVGAYAEALRYYRGCQARFEAAGAEVEAAVNRGTVSLWMLALLGRYDDAWADSARARVVLEKNGDPRLLARVTSSEGNIFLRQDRHHEALERFNRALAMFRERGEPQEIAVTLHNIAVSSIAINDFSGSLESYRELSLYCSEHGMPLLAAQADYNIGYLYFFRGEFSRALEVYQKSRRQCEQIGDGYHLALCDLDQAEIYLELNLNGAASRIARQAREAFEKRGNAYEAAKATTFMAIASSRQGAWAEALSEFSVAHEKFEIEGNSAWMAMTDFYRGVVHHELSSAEKARTSCRAARAYFVGVPWPSRVALCDLLCAQIDLHQGRAESARELCRGALELLKELDLPSLELKALTVLGRIEEHLGEERAAVAAYRKARVLLENLRTHLGGEESKIAFLSDKLEVYESLVHLTLKDTQSDEDLKLAFGYIEQAKSRILADLVMSAGADLRSSPSDNPELLDRIRDLRTSVSQDYNELDRLYAAQVPATDDASGDGAEEERSRQAKQVKQRVATVRLRSREREQELLETMGELRARDSKFAALQNAETAAFDAIRASIPSDAVLLEYFESRGVTYACILGQRVFEIQTLGSRSDIGGTLRLLRNQLAKFGLGAEYLARFGPAAETTLSSCLEDLYGKLVKPIERRLDAKHLIVVPHGVLHQVPFHALQDGADFLLDRFDFSYAPSASLFAMLQGSQSRCGHRSLILGVPDERAPEILAEVEAVAELLPTARVLIGPEATVERLRSLGPESRILHIATHGFFRQDSPMFSAIQLGDTRITLLDLYGLELGAELVVLSGCSTGMHKIESGDELIGLTRGFLYAGAQSLLTSLWDVNDKSTAVLMRIFYENLATHSDHARALGLTMQEIREEYASPYYWAPFVLIGKYSGFEAIPESGTGPHS